MQKVLTAAQMREVDRLTTERYGIPSIILMENAAHAVARVITEKVGGSVKGKSILILCGKGNNGGDGAALARVLLDREARVHVLLIGKVVETKGDARRNLEILLTMKNWSLRLVEVENEDQIAEAFRYYLTVPNQLDVIVDALFGTGLTRPLSDLHQSAMSAAFDYSVESYPNTITISVDLPSGLNADAAEPLSEPFEADTTVAFTAPKLANILPPASHFGHELIIAAIGSPPELIEKCTALTLMTEQQDAANWLARSRFTDASYKNKRGNAFLIAGSETYSGAAVLAGNAAMRSGVGLVTVAAPKECKAEIASRLLPDVILTAIESSETRDLLSKADAIAVGCGLSAADEDVEAFVRNVVEDRTVPVIIDAGALWFYSPFDESVSSPHVSKGLATDDSSHRSPLILTPHEGEFMRLLGTDDKDAIKDRVAAVRDFATKHNVILVLKGERVLIGSPDARVVVNPTGNSGLGKAGNGDTLTGILAGFVAQAMKMNIDIFETVVAAVYVAGMAGDIAEKKFGKRVMTASDVRECLVEVFAEFEVAKLS